MFIKKKGQISIEALIIVSVLIVGGIIFATVYLGQRNKLAQDQSKVLGTIDNIDYSGDFGTITNPPTPPEPPNPNECLPYPEHCCNDYLDYDEEQVDCGGADCRACLPIIEYGCENLGEPTFSPEGGTFNSPINLLLNYIDESCPDAEIRYTTNGSEPTVSDPIFVPYTDYIEIASTTTVKAKVFAERNGNTLSGDTGTNHYIIDSTICNSIPGTVTFNPKGTTYNSPFKVELSYNDKVCSDSSYNILYTIKENGVLSEIEYVYSGPINLVDKDTEITAYVRVMDAEGTDVYGLPKTEIYNYNKFGCDGAIGLPTFNPIGGTYGHPIYLGITYNGGSCSDYNIHYTTNNTEPTTSSPKVGNKAILISVDKNITAKVFAKNSLGADVNGSSKKENYRITAGGSVLCASGVGGGTGTVADPKIICNPEELNDIRYGANLGKHYVLGQDIDLNHSILSNYDFNWGYSSTYGWTPIGFQTNVFTGSLDGNGYKIKNLYINRPTNYNGEYLGLFGYLGGANPTIKNLELVDADITGYGYVGGLVGVSPNNVNSIIDNITVTNIKLNSNNLTAGGIIGANYRGVLQNSTSTGNINGVMVVGGLVGSTGQYSSIINSDSNASVSGTEIIGGLVGMAGGAILNSYFEGDVSGDEYIGGISGKVTTGDINQSYFNGTVTGDTVVGGISGDSGKDGFIFSSYCTNSATINGQTKVGGIVGRIYIGQIDLIIKDSNFSGTVNGISDVGGLLGYGKALNSGSGVQIIETSNLLTDGIVIGDYNVGGVIGSSESTNVDRCKSNGSIVGKNNVGGIIGYNSSQIKNSSFSGTITSSGSGNNFGGIAGINESHYLFNNYSKGNVNAGSNVNNVGGLVGQCKYAASNIYNNYSVSPVTGGNNVGGFIGYSENCGVQKNYSTGAVTGTTNAGGFIGSISAGFYNFNYWNTQTSGQTASVTGTGKTTAEMKQQATFVGFNFNPGDNLWNINAGSTYPYLRQNTQMPLPN